MARREFPKSIKVQIVKRAMQNNGVVYCETCGQQTKQYEIDHKIPDAMGGEPIASNAVLMCKSCHKEKTRADVGAIAKAKRVEARNLGIRKSGKGFPRREKEKLELTKVVSRRPMYEEING